MRTARIAAALVAASLPLTACYSDANQGNAGAVSTGLSGQVAGAGSSAQSAAMQAWIAGFQSANSEVTINYDPVGSGGGRDQFAEGGVDFAGSDRAFEREELAEAAKPCKGGSVLQLPLYVSPIAVAFNLEGVDELNLSAKVLAGIFDQKIRRWDDRSIAADNPGLDLPDLEITPVNRQDDSGTTENFTDYLHAAAPEQWPHEPDGVWPVPGGEAANGNSGVVQAIAAGEGAIGYADASQVGGLGIVSVGVGDGFVPYSPEAAAAIVEASPRESGRGPGDLVVELERDTTDSGQYPIVLVSYSIACSRYDDPVVAELVAAFLSYVASEQGQAVAAQTAGSAPLAPGLRSDVLEAIALIEGTA
ncbi:MAG: phosphate ABC transporter substrate-binding protein PstS [Frankiales bacterium]|nr:MAG: phosphate ABC transporter substrate-binding protein PstS [Frankiales bacterium]